MRVSTSQVACLGSAARWPRPLLLETFNAVPEQMPVAQGSPVTAPRSSQGVYQVLRPALLTSVLDPELGSGDTGFNL